MNNIVLLATYWNEIEWIETSLAQIDRIDPGEIIICDGCFDPTIPNYSTDGTRQIIERYVADKPNAKMVEALRLSLLQHYFFWFKPLPHEETGLITLAKLRVAKRLHRWNLYRLNQMATFNYMISIAERFQPGQWFMSYDCDQFYSDDMLNEFKLVNQDSDINLLVGHEYTFFEDFCTYADDFETRDYNNMPHRIFNDTRFIPTRHPARVLNGRYEIYSSFEKKKYVGLIYHYKIKSPNRLNAGYSLGDRKPPNGSRIRRKVYKDEHPRIIRNYFLQ